VPSIYGRPESEFVEIVDAAYRYLVGLARARRIENYSELSTAIHEATGFEPFHFEMERDQAAIGQLLEDVCERAFSDRPGKKFLLSALVVRKDNRLPGTGFYEMAATHLGIPRNVGEIRRAEVWMEQVNEAWAVYATS
jgi:hypothetical protein